MRDRDTQRSRVYASEGHNSPDFKTIEECQAYVDSICEAAWFQSRWGRRQIEVRPGYGHRNATGGGGIIQLPLWARSQRTILHEMAHCLTLSGPAAHGPQFVAILLTLIKHKRGQKAYDDQHWRFAKNGVKIDWTAVPKPSKHRVVTKAAVAAKERAAASRPLTSIEARQAAAFIRRAVKAGTFGEPGRKPRTQALAIARRLEQ